MQRSLAVGSNTSVWCQLDSGLIHQSIDILVVLPLNMTQFIVGQTYRATSVCDSECHWYFTIDRRTAGSIWTTIDGVMVRRVVKSCSISGTPEEYFMPFGSYSMAASCDARRIV